MTKITLCGSTRFRVQFEEMNRVLSKAGHLVYSVSCFGHGGDMLTAEEKQRLDAVHKRKIEESDAILVLNVDGYIGESTRNEIEHARSTGKDVIYLEPGGADGPVACPFSQCRDPFSANGRDKRGWCAVCYDAC